MSPNALVQVREADNLRAAFGFAASRGDGRTVTRLACAQRWTWLMRGQFAEGRAAFELAVAADVEPLLHAAALNGLAAVDALVGLDNVVAVVKVVGFVASAPDFTGQPAVINGASELLGEVFGDAGAHARSAVGVASLPLDAPVEVELIVEVA